MPTNRNFIDLLRNKKFQHIYEQERQLRHTAFICYLKQLSGGALPKTLAIVDVGWKGTIQDNLFNILCTESTSEIKSIDGYYLGLVAEGAVSDRNRKYGLVFSCVGKRSEYFNIFNENRAMFEVILAADHGSIVSYEIDGRGIASPVRGTFDEEQMIKEKVFPVQAFLFNRFGQLLKLKQLQELPEDRFKQMVADLHARMVFMPMPIERNWFSSIFHVENYGVFERSRFDTHLVKTSFFRKMKFWFEFIKRRGKGELGFWPYKTILEKGGFVLALAYAYARRIGH